MPNRSTFPTTIDTFLEHYDIQASEKASVLRYQTLKTKTTLTTSEQNELAELTATLREKIFTPEDFNKLQDCITNLETFFKNNVEGYIGTKQTEMETFVANSTNLAQEEFNAKVNELNYKGEYNPTSQYYRFNIVSLNGNMYLAKANSYGNPPTDTIYWSLMARKGDKGDAGIGLTFRGIYDNNTNYNIKDAVSLDGIIYYCIAPVLGFTPPNENYWVVFLDTSNMNDMIGDLTQLLTENKLSTVNAINELFNKNIDGGTF